MTIEILRSVLGWAALINYALLIAWFLMFTLAHDGLYRLYGRWFTLSETTYDAIHYGGMGIYKLLIWLFFLGPWLALHIIG